MNRVQDFDGPPSHQFFVYIVYCCVVQIVKNAVQTHTNHIQSVYIIYFRKFEKGGSLRYGGVLVGCWDDRILRYPTRKLTINRRRVIRCGTGRYICGVRDGV